VRRSRVRGLQVGLAALVIAAAAAPAGQARPYLPPKGKLFAGLSGGTSITAYQKMVGKHPAVFETFMTWDTPTGWLANADSGFRSRLAVHISTAAGYGAPGVVSPEGIALGASDRFLVALNRNLARSGRIVYVRLMAEMNGYWNAYAAFNADGVFRGAQNSQHYYVQAWRRSVLILRGGLTATINRSLRRLGLPRLVTHAKRLPRPKVAFLWVPQDAGSPEIAANGPAAFWPGGAYVDWVGTDFYSSYPNFTLLDDFYDEFGGKPFVLSEWSLRGADDPAFVRDVFAWVKTHPRVRMLNYYQGFTADGPVSLSRYPASRRVLRRELSASKFLAYPPEYAHPHKHAAPGPGRPPTPPGLLGLLNGILPPLPPVLGISPGPPDLCVSQLKLCIPGL
jgi:hypothetical protein